MLTINLLQALPNTPLWDRLAIAGLAENDAFIPAYESALIMGNLVTAVLLFGQFGKLRSPAILALAAG